MKYMIRETAPQDYGRISFLLGQAHLRDSYFNERVFERMLERNPGLCYVAVSENDIAGVISKGTAIGSVFGVSDGAFMGYIQKLAVWRSMHRNGVGSALVERLLEQFDKEGIPLVFAHVEKGNVASLGLFKDLGFDVRESHFLIDRGYKKRD